jgi:uncharacterized protein YaaQ
MNTKMIIVILQNINRDRLVHRLNDAQFRVTEFASIGGFLRRKNTTLLIGLADERVEEALTIIREVCPTASGADEHSATVFVLGAPQSYTI